MAALGACFIFAGRVPAQQADTATITTIDVPGAGTAADQGTFAENINASGVISGAYWDTNNIAHGFVREANGTITTFDAPGAGTAANQGTIGENINASDSIAGYYFDANNVVHGFLRTE